MSIPSITASSAAANANAVPAQPAALPPSIPVTRAVPSAPDARQATDHPDKESIDRALATLNKFTEVIAQGVQFSVDEESGRTIVKVVDSETNEVLRQLPTKEALAIARSLDRMQGLLINDKA